MITGVMAIVYDDMGDPFYLIFKRNSNWKGWEFLKGKIKGGETPEQAVERTIKEDAGLGKYKMKKKLSQTRKYAKNGTEQELAVFLIESETYIPVKNYKVSKKHDSYIWVKEGEVLQKLNWDNEKDIFKIATDIIKKKSF
ncbi:MAG: NUDIX domain-containing protein [archaeon]